MSQFKQVTKSDEPIIRDICRCCGSKSVRNTYSYIQRAIYLIRPTQIIYETNGAAFYFAIVCRDHIRLICLAVIANAQGSGIGSIALQRLKHIAITLGKHRITFRTFTKERGKDFWLKHRAKIIGIKGEDFEMELLF